MSGMQDASAPQRLAPGRCRGGTRLNPTSYRPTYRTIKLLGEHAALCGPKSHKQCRPLLFYIYEATSLRVISLGGGGGGGGGGCGAGGVFGCLTGSYILSYYKMTL